MTGVGARSRTCVAKAKTSGRGGHYAPTADWENRATLRGGGEGLSVYSLTVGLCLSTALAVRVLAVDSARPRARALRAGLPPNSLSAGGTPSPPSNTAMSSSTSLCEPGRGE